MTKLHAVRSDVLLGRRQDPSLKARLQQEWIDFRPAAALIALYMGLVLLDGLLTIGLFGLLEGLGLREPADSGGLPIDLPSPRPSSPAEPS